MSNSAKLIKFQMLNLPKPLLDKMWLKQKTCNIDVKKCESKYRIKIKPDCHSAIYWVDGIEAQNGMFIPVFSEFRMDVKPKPGEILGAIALFLKSKEGQGQFMQNYLLPKIQALYQSVGLEKSLLPFSNKEIGKMGQRMDKIRLRYASFIPLQGMTVPARGHFSLWIRKFESLGHELMHVASGLDFIPKKGGNNVFMLLAERIIGYLEGVRKTTAIGRYYGSRIWALNRHNRRAAALEETITYALDDPADADFEKLWDHLRASLMKLEAGAREAIFTKIIRTWANFSSENANKESLEFVHRAIRHKGEIEPDKAE